MRVKYVLSEVLVGLWRNVTMTIAMIITMAVSLTMLGASVLLYMQVDEMKDFYYEQVEVSIFLKTRRHRRAARRRSRPSSTADPLVESVDLRDQGAGVREVQGDVRDAPDLVDVGRARTAARVVPGQAEGPGAVRADQRPSTRSQPGVDDDRRPAASCSTRSSTSSARSRAGAGRRRRAWRRGAAAGRPTRSRSPRTASAARSRS